MTYDFNKVGDKWVNVQTRDGNGGLVWIAKLEIS